MKKSFLVSCCLGVALSWIAIGRASASTPAADNSSNPAYSGGWNTGTNGGTGFGSWTINDGNGGHYIGGTGLGPNTFGIYNTTDPNNTQVTEVLRPFTGSLLPGQTFSINLGFSSFAAGGSVGINLRSGSTDVISLTTTGSGDWQLNDGGSNFSAGSLAIANTPYTFTFTYNGSNSYSFTLTGSAGGMNFTSTNPLIGSIDTFRAFDFNQGGGANFGFDNLAIVPEPSTWVMVAGGIGMLTLLRRRTRL